MATQQQQQEQEQQRREQQVESREQKSSAQTIERRPSVATPFRRGLYGLGPFSVMRRFSEEMDRLFDDFFGSTLFGGLDRPFRLSPFWGETTPWPEIDVHREGNKLVVEADVPGLKKDDITVEVIGDELCISGERRSESERRGVGYYRSERSYGSFCRTIPLPEGVKPDTASATFENGVLRIEMEAPQAEQEQVRRIEVREGTPH